MDGESRKDETVMKKITRVVFVCSKCGREFMFEGVCKVHEEVCGEIEGWRLEQETSERLRKRFYANRTS